MDIPRWASDSFCWAVAHTGIPWLLRETAQRGGAIILCYHDPSPEVLRDHLAFLSRRYSLVSLREVVRWLYGETEGLPPKALVVTLDDGWAGNLLLEPVFAESGVVPTVFVCTQIAGTRRGFWFKAVPEGPEKDRLKTLPDAERLARLAGVGYDELQESDAEPETVGAGELRAMLAWADVQSHTRFHPILPACDDERARREIEGSMAELREILGSSEVYALAYPDGNGTPREAGMAREAGYLCALTIRPGRVRKGADPFALPRVVVADDADRDEIAVRVSGIHGLVRRVVGS